ncbi:uncharacterized protein LOC133283530 [Gastrolobium bilobum]|uniref:uncharacterized protein LOC133283530 n=1 Tax=Gastrolobium bilobum TaxID=150636 RepID=UPI002AB2BF5D|nr:uncharacterized protein LOC133283530 [Gastrolobium bilobum]
MKGVSHLTGMMQPYLEPAEDRETVDRQLNAFRKHKPPSFDGSYDPIAAARWIQTLDKIFRVMQCTDPQKLMFATYMLERDAHEWWMNISQVYEMQERKYGEFDQLVQGSLTVDEYLAQFNELAKFAYFRIAMPTSTFLASKFRRGLNEEIADRIVGAASRDFGILVQQCIDIKDACTVSKVKKAKLSEIKGTGGSTS